MYASSGTLEVAGWENGVECVCVDTAGWSAGPATLTLMNKQSIDAYFFTHATN